MSAGHIKVLGGPHMAQACSMLNAMCQEDQRKLFGAKGVCKMFIGDVGSISSTFYVQLLRLQSPKA
jgi:hypothetical protein